MIRRFKYIGLSLSPQTKAEITNLLDLLKRSVPASQKINWFDPSTDHVNLFFLGNLSLHRLDDAAQAIRSSALFPPFELQPKFLSYLYTSKNQPDSEIILTVSDPTQLLVTLHKNIFDQLVNLGFSPSKRLEEKIVIGLLPPRRHEHEQKEILSKLTEAETLQLSPFLTEKIDLYERDLEGKNFHLLKSTTLK